MRTSLGLLLCIALLGACTRRNLDVPEDGGTLEDGGTVADLGRPTDDLTPVHCNGLDEKACLAAGCRADYCDLCDCRGNQFIGCSDPGSDGQPCPALPCDSSDCGCHKYDSDEQTCGTIDGCAPYYCYNECALTNEYRGCYGPLDGEPGCPIYDCSDDCRSDQDCASRAGFCLAPGEIFCGDVCENPDVTCDQDNDCEDGWICEAVKCACASNIKACTPGCIASTQCPVGMTCEDEHCRPTTCANGQECPSQFFCAGTAGGTCVRRSCKADKDCANGFCVEGACYDEVGQCLLLPG